MRRFLAAPAAAVDGEVLINQAEVNAGGIGPGDGAGFPATLSRSGRYKLTGNLKVPAGKNGIVVTAHDVTIDLNGFTITSAPPGAGVERRLCCQRQRAAGRERHHRWFSS
jgi:hypothetical protein